MQHEPEDLPRQVLADALQHHWGLDVTDLAHAPLGFGSHHWVATCGDDTKRFVTADHLPDVSTQDGDTNDERFSGLLAAFETACALRDAGLEFVLSPNRTNTGAALARMASDWSVAMFPFVEAEPIGPGPWDGVADAEQAAELVGRLHGATPPASLRNWSKAIPHRDALEKALHDLQRPWHGGPFAEPTRALLTRHAQVLETALSLHDRLADQALGTVASWVVTHGEPHSANFLRTTAGDILLIDWDTVRLAPRERDLELGEGNQFEAYRRVAAPPPLRPEAQQLFRVRWSLQDICVFVRMFHSEHGESEDETASWRYLNSELARL